MITEDRDVKLRSIDQAGGVLDCGRTTIYALIKNGDLVAVKLGRHTKVTQASIDAYVARLVKAAG